ncbi:MAG: Ni/Fe hydrogenase subunit alpha [bacterium]
MTKGAFGDSPIIFMKIKINEINKLEGHISFQAALDKGDVKMAKITVEEGARMIEGILIGRNYYEAPIITARICGICPVVHNLTSVKAIENALSMKVSSEIIALRKIMLAAQIAQSHILHLYFCSLPDFFCLSDNFKLLKKFPEEGKKAINIRDYANKVVEVIGGREIHPINSVVGGFNVMPKEKDLAELRKEIKDILKNALDLGEFFEKLKYPKFSRETSYVSLEAKSEYGFYDGGLRESVSMSHGKIPLNLPLKKGENRFLDLIKEVESGNVEKRAEIDGKSYMIGAIARVYNNHGKLMPKAKNIFLKNKKELMEFNSFYNILAQAIELVHFCEVIEKELKYYRDKALSCSSKKIKLCSGRGEAMCEAPRGILYHSYELDENGKILNCNIITPTAQFLNNMEDDMKVYLKDDKNQTAKKIKFLIRAYDPCISCATH